MSDDQRPLSQAEIDALLEALSTNPPDSGAAAPAQDSRSDESQAVSTNSPQASAASTVFPEHVHTALDNPRLQRTLNLPVTMFVSLGQKNVPTRSLLNWGIGTQIVLNREWQRAVSIKINGLEVGEGRVVIVGNNFGVEITKWGHA
jgi:flagellar motor switch protein FliN/FliY